MKKLAVVAFAAVMALCLAGCLAARQTVEFNGCSFEVPSGEIERTDDDSYMLSLTESKGADGSYAFISWDYHDVSELKFVDIGTFLDADNIEKTKKYDGADLTCVRTKIEDGRVGHYKTLRLDELTYSGKPSDPGYRITYSSELRVQVHDKAYVTIRFSASDEATMDKHQAVVDEMFASVKLI